MEDYLEAILRLAREGGVARVRDIAGVLGVKQSSVTGALRQLAEKELVNYRPYEVITLTPRGEGEALKVARRHEVLSRFFKDALGVPAPSADADACRVEHGLSRETVERLTAFMEFIQDCPRLGAEWVRSWSDCTPEGRGQKKCRACIERCGGEARMRLPKPRPGERNDPRRGETGR